MGPPDQAIFAVKDILSGCFQEMRFARATELARTRQYLEATALLMPNGRQPSHPKELDLLARIAAQQRRFSDAEKLWNDASKLAPENNAYRNAARQAAKARQTWMQIKQTAFAVIAALVLSGLILAAITFFSGGSQQPGRQTAVPAKSQSSVPIKP